ncbi:MAG: flagellar protein FlgN [Deltaproteobacteria bacterium]|nr:flagellar protein FlgN [Deltaproteobacteria bacterium]
MDAVKEKAFEKLVSNLEDLIKFYLQLLDLARKEKEALVEADANKILELNSQKELHLQKIKLADTLRFKHAKELCVMIKADSENPRLLEIAQKIPGVMGDQLRNLHKTLDMVITRIIEINKDNELLTQKALQALNGTMNNIKETLSGKKTYERKGNYKQGPEQSGNFVSKEI